MRRLHRPALAHAAVPTALVSTIALSLTGAPAAAGSDHLPASTPRGLHLKAMPRVAAASVPASVHTVAAGDTVSAIAARYGLRTADVLTWNGLGWSSIIRPGQTLLLSGAAQATPAPAASAASTTHTVAAGETLWSIANANGVALADLFAANALTRSSIIYPGQKLAIPGDEPAPAPLVLASSSTPLPAEPVTLDGEQIANVEAIIAVGRSRGVSDRGIAIALATAMVESWIRNLDWGDRDSLGLFQQRPSQGWGEEAEVRDVHRAAAAFFGGADDPNGVRTQGLLDIAGWEDLDFGAAAQAVQRSAYPERYGPWEQQATSWIALYG